MPQFGQLARTIGRGLTRGFSRTPQPYRAPLPGMNSEFGGTSINDLKRYGNAHRITEAPDKPRLTPEFSPVVPGVRSKTPVVDEFFHNAPIQIPGGGPRTPGFGELDLPMSLPTPGDRLPDLVPPSPSVRGPVGGPPALPASVGDNRAGSASLAAALASIPAPHVTGPSGFAGLGVQSAPRFEGPSLRQMGMDASNRDFAESKMHEFFSDFNNHVGDGFGGSIEPLKKAWLKLDAGLVPTGPDWLHSSWRRGTI